MALSPFNVRVYGIVINPDNQVLITQEYRFGKLITKFPGGGLEFGEGTIDCLKREFREELNAEINRLKHFYTTDFFQASAFNSKQQVISIYYTADMENHTSVDVKTELNMENLSEGDQIFRWKPIADLTIGDFTFPIDRKVGGMIIESLNT